MELDVSKPPQQRVTSLSVLCTSCRVPVRRPVEDEAEYGVVLPSYLADGGDGFSMIKDEMLKHDSGETLARDGISISSSENRFSFLCRRFGHRCFVQLPHTETESLSVCGGTNQDRQRRLRSAAITGALLDADRHAENIQLRQRRLVSNHNVPFLK